MRVFNHLELMKSRFTLLITLIGLLNFSQSKAQIKVPAINFSYSEVNSGNSIKNVNVRANSVPVCTPLGARTIKKANICGKLNLLKLGDDYRFGENAFNGTITVDIKGYSYSNTLTPVYTATGKLTIFGSGLTTGYKPEQVFSFDFTAQHPYVDYFEITPSFVGSNNLPQGLFNLDVFYTEEFTYAVSSSITINPLPIYQDLVLLDTNSVTFSWTPVCALDSAPNYQFQLLRLYNKNPLATDEESIIAEIDWNKALSIETGSNATSLKLTVTEGTGYYIWRVRPIGNYYKGGIANDTNWGAWSNVGPFIQSITSTPNTQNVSTFGSGTPYLFFFYQQDDNKNWIYSRTFVEGDTRDNSPINISEKMVFANSLQMVKQSQAKLNTENKVIANQTIQDYSGRPSLTTMAAPLYDQKYLAYKNNYIKNHNDSLYTAKDFDKDHNFRNPSMIANSELTNYYSDLNPDPTIPSADGYAFSRTLYFRDGTNRPKEQSSPGETHSIKLGTTHTIRNSNAAVSDQELIRLFGDEAPEAASVHKTIATDANNASSVSYISKEGQVIATCLSSPGGSGLDTLENDGKFMVNDTITGSTQYTEYGFTSVKNITFTQLTELTLNYQITLPNYNTTFLSCFSHCRSCDYKITYFIHDVNNPDNDWQSSFQTQPSFPCGINQDGELITKTLNPGDYIIERRVEANTLNPDTQKHYIDEEMSDISTQLNTKFSQLNTTTGIVIEKNKQVVFKNLYDYLNSNDDDDLENLNVYLGLASTDTNTFLHIKFECDTLIIPVRHCDKHTCTDLDFEAYLYGRLGVSAQPNTLLLNTYMPEYTSNGGFNTVIANMVAEPNNLYDCEKLWTCWKSVVNNYPDTKNMYASANTPLPSLSEQFLNCAGYNLEGYSTTATGTTGYNIYPYKYFKYIRNAQNPSLCEYYNFNLLLNNQPEEHSFVGNSLQTPNEWYYFKKCLSSIPDPAPASSTAIVNVSEGMTDTCIKICKTRFESFKTSLVNVYESHQVSIIGNRDLYAGTLSIQDSIPLSTIYCQAQSLEDECISMCELTVFPDSVGTQQQQLNFKKAMTYSYELDVTNEYGNCNSGFTKLERSVSKNSMYERYLNNELLDFKHNVGFKGDTFNYVKALLKFDPSVSSNGCYSGMQTNPYVYVNKDFTSAFEIGSNSLSTDKDSVTYNDGGNSTTTITYPKNIVPGQSYTLTAKIKMLQSFMGNYFFRSTYSNSNQDIISIDSYALAPDNLYSFGDQSANNYHQGDWSDAPIPAGAVLSYSVTFHFDEINYSAYNIQFITGNSGGQNLSLNICPRFQYVNKNNTNDTLQIPSNFNCLHCGNNPINVLPHTANTTLICNELCNAASSCDPVCIRWKPLEFPPSTSFFGDPTDSIPLYDTINFISCAQGSKSYVKSYLNGQIESLIAARRDKLKLTYIDKCVTSAKNMDIVSTQYPLGYYHYTLYYYDRAGNLVKTVPPAGVAASDAYTRKTSHPPHTLVTQYQQNSLKQVVRQKTPDGGETKFWYDAKSQLRFSQNAKQLALGNNTYSYTKYDNLGRIIEVGEIIVTDNTKITDGTYVNDINFPATGGKEITQTFYSVPAGIVTFIGFPARYLQNRVSYSISDVDGNMSTYDDHVETYFSYDPHGNVEWMGQYVGNKILSFIAYEYDLISGSVLKVKYNEGQPDQFFHRYMYDADKRIRSVETSRDNIIWDKDATYQYYAHGPLKRKELGHDKVQGVDYVYTIQGWLKGINHSSLDANNDPAKDGLAGLPQQFTAKDVYGMMLTYFAGDFNRSSSPYNSATANAFHLQGVDLFNGNISSWTNNIYAPNFLVPPVDPFAGNTYRYDELNRITKSDFRTFNGTGFNPSSNNFGESFTYDANGNIKTLNRNSTVAMDDLIYNYSNTSKNQLTSVTDLVPTTADATDIETQTNAANYQYDAIGNLINDHSENIVINWNVYGKIKSIVKPNQTINFLYNASGNRVFKEVVDGVGAAGTAYMTDASGNQMAIYGASKPNTQSYYSFGSFNMAEQPIYGSDRLGINTKSATVDNSLTGNSAKLPLPGRYNHTEAIPNMYVPSVTDERKLNTSTGAFVNNSSVGVNGYHAAGAATILDNAGNIVLRASSASVRVGNTYKSYCYLYNQNNQLIANSQGIEVDPNSQCALIKMPNNSSSSKYYYLFSINAGKVYYHLIDMAANGGNGRVDAVAKNKLVNSLNAINGVYACNTMKVLEDLSGGQSQLYMPIYFNGFTFIVAANITDYNSLPTDGSGNKYFNISFVTNHKSTTNKNDNLDSELEMLYDKTSPDQNLYLVAANNTLDPVKGWRIGQLIKYKFTNTNHTTSTKVNTLTVLNNKVLSGLAYNPNEKSIYYKMSDDIHSGRSGYSGPMLSIGKTDNNFINNTTVNTGNGGDIRVGADNRMYIPKPLSNTITVLQYGIARTPIIIANNNFLGIMPVYRHVIKPDSTPALAFRGSVYTRELVGKTYQLTDHLQNVRATLSDMKKWNDDGDGVPEGGEFTASVESYNSYYAFGSIITARTSPVSTKPYRFAFNGQTRDDEVYGVTGSLNTAQFWEYDTRLGRRWNLDPKPTVGISDYACFANNPIWFTDVLGDSSVFNNKGGKIHYDPKDKDLRVFMKDGDKLTLIGELGKKVDVNKIFDNMLKEHGNQTYGMGVGQWFLNVKKDGVWDLKDNKNTIFGVAWAFDESVEQKGKLKTNFLYKDFNKGTQIVNAADLGNYHAGYMGSMINIGQLTQKIGAGVVETLKNHNFISTLFSTNDFLKAPYGDAANDYKWNTRGMNDGHKNRGRCFIYE